MPKVSVIVPVYKAEAYIRRCLDSIQNQTFADFEVILVDDASPDKSGQICDEYVEEDRRFHVIHKEQNGGVGSARQTGLDAVIGDYVIHADPDDWVEPQMLEDLYAKAIETDADLVYCDFYQDYANGMSKYVSQRMTSPLTSENMLVALLEGYIHGACWNKLIRVDKIVKLNLGFIPGIDICEDRQFVMGLLVNGGTISYVNHAYYHYCLGNNCNSLTLLAEKKNLVRTNKYFLDYAVKYLSFIPYYRDRYIMNNLYFVVISSTVSQKVYNENFIEFLPYIKCVVSPFRYVVVLTSFYGFKNIWNHLANIWHKCHSVWRREL